MTSNILALVERLENAGEGSRELDAEIALAVGCTKAVQIQPYKPNMVLHPNGRTIELPHYTTSIDAALELVPEGCPWEMKSVGMVDMGTTSGPVEGIAATPALALVVACLKAIEARQGE